MKQLTTVFRRHRWLLLAIGYLLVLAFAVMYLRVTISVPPEGDDKLTLNKWMYDFERMPFWQYLLQDLQEKIGAALVEDPPATLKDGGAIRSGYNSEVDELRDIAEVDLNPVFAWEKGLAVADARIVLQARGRKTALREGRDPRPYAEETTSIRG